MSSLQPTIHEPLPFDILGSIFYYYRSHETIRYPLETLLLVSKFWAEAALSHRALWGLLKIYIGHKPTIKIWDTRLPLRLARAGPTTPLYIDLRNYLDMPWCPKAQIAVQNDPLFSPLPCHKDHDDGYNDELCTCYEAARASVHEALRRITGKSGKLCARWRSFKLDLGHCEDGIKGTERVAIALSYPTPQLTTLALRNVQFDDDISFSVFPSTPVLKDITIVDCTFPSLPPFDNIRRATIGWKDNLEDFQDFSTFRQATQVENLRLYLPFTAGVGIPGRFDGLQTLHISGNNFPHELYHCEMPILSALILEYEFENFLVHFLNCRGFVAQELRSITLLWKPPLLLSSETILETFSSLWQLLTRARNLKSITSDRMTLTILLRVVWQFEKKGVPPGYNIKSPQIDSIWIVNPAIKERVCLRGDETSKRLEEIAEGWNLIPLDCPKEDFISLLQAEAALQSIFNPENEPETE